MRMVEVRILPPQPIPTLPPRNQESLRQPYVICCPIVFMLLSNIIAEIVSKSVPTHPTVAIKPTGRRDQPRGKDSVETHYWGRISS